MHFQLTDLNPLGAIGANSHLLEIGPFCLIIDAGLHPKRTGKGAMPALHTTRGKLVDLVVLTHCHLDHVGSLPVDSSVPVAGLAGGAEAGRSA